MATAEADRARLGRVLDDSLELLGGERAAGVAALRSRLAANQFRVLVVGEAKRGKSTFVNALIGRDVLPTGVLPVTALVTTIVHGERDSVAVTYTEGRTEDVPVSALAGYVTEDANPDNARGVATVTVTLAAPLLADGVQLVDTPGTGSVFAHNTQAAQAGLDDVDAAIFVFSADPPISAAESDFLDRVRERAQFMLFVLNKVDYLTASDAASVHDFTERTLAKRLGHEVELFDCSAARGLAASRAGDRDGWQASGMAAFEAALRERLAEVRDLALTASVVTHATRLVQAQRDDVALSLRVLRLREEDDAERIAQFERCLAEARTRRDDVHTLAQARLRQILQRLDVEAEQLARRLSARTAAALEELLASESAVSMRPRELEEAGHHACARIVAQGVEEWQAEQAAVLGSGLREVMRLLTGDVAAALEQIRDAARTILDVELALAYGSTQLPASTHFHFDFSEYAGPTELLAGAVRRRLPNPLARRRAIAWLARETDDLVQRHVGRARADLQERLMEAGRRVSAGALEQLDDVATRLGDVVAAARASAPQDLTARQHTLAADLARLADLETRLADCRPPAVAPASLGTPR